MTIEQQYLINDAPIRADHMAGPPQGYWTYDDYMLIPEDGHRYEVIQGVLYMAPSPTDGHQGSNMRFSYYLFLHVELAGLGRVFAAPFDVKLAEKDVVQPDIVILLKEHLDRIIGTVHGSPDLVVEIASPGTSSYDRTKKMNAYATAKVPEYWIASPINRTVELFLLRDEKYQSQGVFGGQELLPSQIIPNLPVQVEQFFA